MLAKPEKRSTVYNVLLFFNKKCQFKVEYAMIIGNSKGAVSYAYNNKSRI